MSNDQGSIQPYISEASMILREMGRISALREMPDGLPELPEFKNFPGLPFKDGIPYWIFHSGKSRKGKLKIAISDLSNFFDLRYNYFGVLVGIPEDAAKDVQNMANRIHSDDVEPTLEEVENVVRRSFPPICDAFEKMLLCGLEQGLADDGYELDADDVLEEIRMSQDGKNIAHLHQ